MQKTNSKDLTKINLILKKGQFTDGQWSQKPPDLPHYYKILGYEMFSRPFRRALIDSLNKFYYKGRLSKQTWEKFRLKARLGEAYEVEVIRIVIRILEDESAR